MKKLYVFAMVVGAAVPLYLFSGHFAAHGFGLSKFLEESFATQAASGLVADLLLSATLGLVVFGREARQLGVKPFWLVVLGTFLIGFSFGFPLYLYLREKARESRVSSPTVSFQGNASAR